MLQKKLLLVCILIITMSGCEYFWECPTKTERKIGQLIEQSVSDTAIIDLQTLVDFEWDTLYWIYRGSSDLDRTLLNNSIETTKCCNIWLVYKNKGEIVQVEKNQMQTDIPEGSVSVYETNANGSYFLFHKGNCVCKGVRTSVKKRYYSLIVRSEQD